MKMKINHVAILLVASTLAMIGLVIFQYKWIHHSQNLSDEIFNQRASMALCSTLEDYGEGVSCGEPDCAIMCGSEPGTAKADAPNDSASALLPDLMGNEAFHADLRKTLDFYNIDLSYKMAQTTCAPSPKDKSATPMCVVNIPPHIDQQESFVTLSFPEKKDVMFDKIRYMIGTSILILAFTAFVLLLANYWLMKQKKLLKTNAEIYNNMAHEFRTPLTNIQLAANLLTKDPTNPAKDKFVEVIQKENTRLIQQVERVLHMARLDNGDYALKNESLNMSALLHAVIEDMHMQISERNANVLVEQMPTDYEVQGDRLHLTNVFRNLIDNALKYSGQQPEIKISAREEKDGLLISIQDNGIGIPASQSQLIFEKFQRIQDGRMDGEKGFGLGLSYVKRIVELHKGFIQLDCGVQQGSRFNVFLPKFC